MTDPDLKELFPENPDELKPWHPLMGFGWDAVRLVRSWHFCGIVDAAGKEADLSDAGARHRNALKF